MSVWALTRPRDTTDVIIAAPRGGIPAPKRWISRSMRCFSRIALRRTPFNRCESGGNYLSSPLVGSEARRHGYQEGIAPDVNGYISGRRRRKPV